MPLVVNTSSWLWVLNNVYFPQRFGGGKSIFNLIYSNLPGRNADYISNGTTVALGRDATKGKRFTGSKIADGGIRWRINQRLQAVREDVLKGRDPEKNARMVSDYYGRLAATSSPKKDGRGSIGALEKDFTKMDKLLVQTRGGGCLPTSAINSFFLNKVGYKRLKEIATISTSGSKANARDSVTWMLEGKPQKIYYEDLKYFEHCGGGSALLRSLHLALDLHAVENTGRQKEFIVLKMNRIFPNKLNKSIGNNQERDIRGELLQYKDNPNAIITAGGAVHMKPCRYVRTPVIDQLRTKMTYDLGKLRAESLQTTLAGGHEYSVVSVGEDVVKFIDPIIPVQLGFLPFDKFVECFRVLRVIGVE